MAKKYIKDYRLTDSLDAKGRIRSTSEYVGAYYSRCIAPAQAKREGILLSGLCVFAWAVWLVPLLFDNGAMHLFFVLFPHIFSALTLWMLSTAAYTALTAPDPMKRKEADRLNKWLPATALATAILAGVCLIGMAVALIFKLDVHYEHPFNGYDRLYAGCTAALCAAALVAFSRRKFFRTEER